jgi:HEAT repeat protein
MAKATFVDVSAALADDDPGVRRSACQVAAALPAVPPDALAGSLHDGDPSVVEMAAWALGEKGPAAADVVAPLAAVATAHEEPLCREAAIAALGAIGDEGGLGAILAGTRDRATVRRRAVIALAPFSGDEVDAALRRARDDKDWQVRQAAEDLS